jgi:hypothetical protein
VTSFRQPAALAIAGLVAAIAALPLLQGSGWFFPVPLAPLIFAAWAWRSGTDVTATGLRVRALFGSRDIAWSRVDALLPAPRGTVVAALTDGNRIALTAVRREDLPKLVEASGKRLEAAQ